MTNRTPIQAITANFITNYVGMQDHSAIHLEGALADGSTFDHAISIDSARELLGDLEEAVDAEEEHRNVGAAFAMDRGAA
ncbi:hypothetical protein [Brevibacterium oceani]|uniref:hypothetical protein n=1 Tax=Brevibacterium oceani TaxID=358099 RepID=UPI0015E79A36|nr:hypothetical protein [Brevibacterium oceani]